MIVFLCFFILINIMILLIKIVIEGKYKIKF